MSFRSTKTPFKYMKQFKAFAGDYEYLLTLSDEGQLYCLSEQQVYAINVQLDYIGWLTRWYNTDDVTQTTVDRLKSDIAEALMSCVDVSILVDQANENLITTVTNRAIQSQTLRDIYADEYTGSPTSINPNAPTTTWSYSGTDDGEAALCAALTAFVYQFARSQADSVRAGQVGGLAAISLIALLLIPGLNIFFVVGAAIAVLAGLGTVGVTTEAAIQALTDTDALGNVICCMRDSMANDSVSSATFEASLGGCSFGVGSHEQIIADFLTPTLADNYLTFLDFMGVGYVGVTTDEPIPECPCETPPPEDCDAINTTTPQSWSPTASDYGVMTGTGMAGALYIPDGLYYFRWFVPAASIGSGITSYKLKFNQTLANVTLYRGNTLTSDNILGSIGATASDELICDATTHGSSVSYPFDNVVSWQLRVTGDVVPGSFRVEAVCIEP